MNIKSVLNSLKESVKMTKRSFMLWSFVVFVLICFFFTKDNVFTLLKSVATIRQQKADMVTLIRENAELDRQIEVMYTNRDTIERYAREHYNLKAPGEDVYIFDEK